MFHNQTTYTINGEVDGTRVLIIHSQWGTDLDTILLGEGYFVINSQSLPDVMVLETYDLLIVDGQYLNDISTLVEAVRRGLNVIIFPYMIGWSYEMLLDYFGVNIIGGYTYSELTQFVESEAFTSVRSITVNCAPMEPYVTGLESFLVGDPARARAS